MIQIYESQSQFSHYALALSPTASLLLSQTQEGIVAKPSVIV